MSISVVIPTYNRAATLERVLPSYLDPAATEIIIVDDGGEDHTAEVVAKFQRLDDRVRYLPLGQNRGVAVARNTGISNSRGDYVFFGEDDAYLADQALSRLLSCARDTGADIIGPRLIYMQVDQSEADALAHSVDGPPVDLNSMRFQFNNKASGPVPAMHALMLIRRDVFDSVRYDDRFVGSAWGEETDFCLSAGTAGYRLYFCPSAVVFHLPRVRTGGAWNRSRWAYEKSAVSNEAYLLGKHSVFLRAQGYISRSPQRILALFIAQRVAFNIRLLVRVALGERAFSRLVRAVRGVG